MGLRSRPGKLTSSGAGRLTPVAFFHGGGQLATVLSLGAGAVSFTHVVKAMEPLFSALVAAVWFRQVFRWQVYAALIPVVAGVSLACAKGKSVRSRGGFRESRNAAVRCSVDLFEVSNVRTACTFENSERTETA